MGGAVVDDREKYTKMAEKVFADARQRGLYIEALADLIIRISTLESQVKRLQDCINGTYLDCRAEDEDDI